MSNEIHVGALLTRRPEAIYTLSVVFYFMTGYGRITARAYELA